MRASVVTKADRDGPKRAALYPETAGDLLVRLAGNGKREFIAIGPPTPENVERAQELADEYNEAFGVLKRPGARTKPLTIGKLGAQYLETGMALERLADSTQEDRTYLLAEDGPLLGPLGDLRPTELGVQVLVDWWEIHIVEGERDTKTGRNHLDALSAVFRYAIVRGHAETNPVDAFRSTLRALNRSKASRTERGPSDKRHPIESADELQAFVQISEQWRALGQPKRKLSKHERILIGDVHLVNMLQLDAGLRLGEAMALRWGSLHFSADPDDTSRRLEVVEAKARGKHLGTPKSGRTRVVAMSRRLRGLLLERHMELGRPGPEERVIVRRDPKPYRQRHFAGICAKAKIGPRQPKDLRDSFASHLLSMGVKLGWISEQLGHGNAYVTAQHYARQIEESSYSEPVALRPGEVPSDLLSRTAHKAPTIVHKAEIGAPETRDR